jgi:DNA-directed RNA polymerase subunit M/transcription elongation factor TFIIS
MRIIQNPQEFRTNISQKINNIIDDEILSINIEKGVFNYSLKEASLKKIIKKWENPRFVQLYIYRLRSIYINLKNKEFLNQIKNNEITVQSVAFMTHQEMNTSRWRELIETKMIRDANKYSNNIQASTDMFTCKKCKSKRCTYYELQTRSADEPATIFITCLDCGKNWKS